MTMKLLFQLHNSSAEVLTENAHPISGRNSVYLVRLLLFRLLPVLYTPFLSTPVLSTPAIVFLCQYFYGT